VELNTIAASFGCLSTLVSRLHRDLLSHHPGAAGVALEQLPAQDAMAGIADAIAAAHDAYVTTHDAAAAATVMVVQPGERNAYDQQWLQAALWERAGVRMLRRTLAEVAAQGRVHADGHLTCGEGLGGRGTEPESAKRCLSPGRCGRAALLRRLSAHSGSLAQHSSPARLTAPSLRPSATLRCRLDGQRVSVFYLRSGYAPTDYPTDAEWEARRLMERSDAVSCPSVAYQLVGAKKVQQDLAAPGEW